MKATELQVSNDYLILYGPYTKENYNEKLKRLNLPCTKIEMIEVEFKDPAMNPYRITGVQFIKWEGKSIRISTLKTLQTGKDRQLTMVTRNIIDISTNQINSITLFYSPGPDAYNNIADEKEDTTF